VKYLEHSRTEVRDTKRFDMKIMFFLICLSLIVAIGFLIAFLWATRTGQFDDDYTPSVRMLFGNDTRQIGLVHTESAENTEV
jgi:cbb3-type cytochrome oxidase maturation protein